MALNPADIPSTVPHNKRFFYWHNPRPDEIGETCIEFLKQLDGPTHIHISGANSQRARAIVTLSHGNEPSGLQALFDALKKGIKPVVDLHCFLPSVAAAKQAPGFFYRSLPEQRDFNRCFKPPFDHDEQGLLALELIQCLQRIKPECLIDIHNTSGSGPAFGVTTFMDDRHNALVSLFTHRMIVTELHLGSLMEISESFLPTVTIECGGALDSESSKIAVEGLQRYMTLNNVLSERHDLLDMEYFHNPIRLELRPGNKICYSNHPAGDPELVLFPDIENYNFGFVDDTCQLGFIKQDVANTLTAVDRHGNECVDYFFSKRDDKLFPRRKLKLFMVTTSAAIAKDDCILYFVPA